MPSDQTAVGTAAPCTAWKHYKGGLYLVLDICRLEATNEPAVLYQEISGDPSAPKWVRPLSEWVAIVPGTNVQRFRLYERSDDA